MGTECARSRCVPLDRRRQHLDVLERVLGSAHDDDELQPHPDVVELTVKPWLAGTTTSVIQMTVLGRGDTSTRSRHHDEDDND
jgi:hypothetical protein